METGPQYKKDDPFKAAARWHQSEYRAHALKVGYRDYGNRLTEADGRALMNYYDGLGVREALRERYPAYSGKRDADLLRSEHIPFNMLAPLAARPDMMPQVLREAFGLDLNQPIHMKIEWAPSPADAYLGDLTSFDTYIQGRDADGALAGVGIEVKYTERGYRIGSSEAGRVKDRTSAYWVTTRESGLFSRDRQEELAEDDLRQIWRNHLLGLAMVRRRDIDRFVSVTLYPSGNHHIADALKKYRTHLKPSAQDSICGCTFEQYISSLRGDDEIEAWKNYLKKRYHFLKKRPPPDKRKMNPQKLIHHATN